LDFHLTSEDLARLFGPFGEVLSIQLPRDKEGRLRGMGFIEFVEHEAAKRALEEMDGYRIGQRDLRIDVFREKAQFTKHNRQPDQDTQNPQSSTGTSRPPGGLKSRSRS
jgi:RNA recognition motif-containing protein